MSTFVHLQQEGMDDRGLIPGLARQIQLRMRIAGRRLILLLDNATSHSSEGLRLTNVVVRFLPSNTTAHIQPLDVGIIRNLLQRSAGVLLPVVH